MGTENALDESVSVVRRPPVATFVTVTEAPAIAAPDESCTSPTIPPTVDSCASNGRSTRNVNKKPQRRSCDSFLQNQQDYTGIQYRYQGLSFLVASSKLPGNFGDKLRSISAAYTSQSAGPSPRSRKIRTQKLPVINSKKIYNSAGVNLYIRYKAGHTRGKYSIRCGPHLCDCASEVVRLCSLNSHRCSGSERLNL